MEIGVVMGLGGGLREGREGGGGREGKGGEDLFLSLYRLILPPSPSPFSLYILA